MWRDKKRVVDAIKLDGAKDWIRVGEEFVGSTVTGITTNAAAWHEYPPTSGKRYNVQIQFNDGGMLCASQVLGIELHEEPR